MLISIFDTTGNTPEQRAIIQSALDKCDFDFTRLLPGLKERTGRDSIPIEWKSLTGHSGEAHYSGKIVLATSLIGRPLDGEITFLAEAAHMVDFFLMTPEQRRELFVLFHDIGMDESHYGEHGWFEETGNQDYWSWVGEAWMYGFIAAFTSLSVPANWGGFDHRLTQDDIEKVRALMAPPETPVVVPEETPENEPLPVPTPEPIPTPDKDKCPALMALKERRFRDAGELVKYRVSVLLGRF